MKNDAVESEGDLTNARSSPLAALLGRRMAEAGVSLSQLAIRSNVPKTTLHRWLRGDAVRPYHRAHLLQVAVALQLHRVATNQLLRAAELPSLAVLAKAGVPDEMEVLAHWQPSGPTVLPAPLNSFVGREREITDIAELLAKERVRLVTLTGIGGSGKTRLAIRVAREVDDVFEHGVFFVPLATIGNPDLLLPTIAGAVGLRDVIDAAVPNRLIDWLRPRRVLLLLDNLEQLVESSSIIAELLHAAPGVTVLATSRIPLRLTGEYAWAVEPFPVPSGERTRRSLGENPAVALFRNRAHAANPRREIDDEELRSIAEMCVRLDGLPLAIELAAARTRDRAPAQLLVDFPNTLDLASDGPRDAPARHQTVRATIAWSLDLLSEAERALLLRLTVFVGGWTAEAAAAVALSESRARESVRAMLQSLTDANLVHQITSPMGTTRYQMLETIREYGRERLGSDAETTFLRDRHATHFLELAESAPPYVPEARMGDWYARVEADLDNVRAALTWLDARHDLERLARFVAALWPYWHEYLRVEEGRAWLQAVVAHRAALSPTLRAQILTGACLLASAQADFAVAQTLGDEALELWRTLDEHHGPALIFRQLGWGNYLRGLSASSLSLAVSALDEWRQIGDPHGIALAVGDLALTQCVLGHLDDAALSLTQAEQSYQQLHDAPGLARTRRDQGVHALLCGDLEGAIALLEDAVNRLRETGRNYLLPGALCYLGTAYCFAGKLEMALRYYRMGLELPNSLEDTSHLALTLLGFAAVAIRTSNGERAAILCGAAATVQQEHHMALPPSVQAIYERETGQLLGQLGKAAFERSFALGCQMTTAEALDFAQSRNVGD